MKLQNFCSIEIDSDKLIGHIFAQISGQPSDRPLADASDSWLQSRTKTDLSGLLVVKELWDWDCWIVQL